MKTLVFVVLASAVILSVDGQGFSCTSSAQFTTNFDGSRGTATCSSGVDLSGRCSGCCEAWGMSIGISKDQITGFVSSDGTRCSCCGFGLSGTNVFAQTVSK